MTNHRIKLAFVSAAHLHTRGLLRAALDCAEAEVVGLSEEDDELRQFFQHEHPELRVYKTSAELYDKEHPQAIVTCADNLKSAEVVAEAAAHGCHVMKEKPMAASLELAEQMLTTATRAGVRMMVNWPTNWQPSIHHLKTLVDAGTIGDVWQVHHRAGHGGPPADYATRGPIARVGWGWLIERDTNGGGAFVDFCSYGAVLSRWIMGQPARVVALGGRYSKGFFTVEDNAILVLGYPRGHSVCEGTWTQPAVPVRVPAMVYGTQGSVAITGNSELSVATSKAPAAPEVLASPALAAHCQSGPAYFVHQLLAEAPFEGLVNAQLSRDAQEVLEAGLQSMRLGAAVGLPLTPFLA